MVALASVSALIASIAANVDAQTIKPPGMAVEASAPFSWYLVPSDEIGFKDCPQGFQVTYEGDLNNGYGELDFIAGSPAAPVNQRLKTLYKGYMPVLEYGFNRNGARYDFEIFGAPVKLDPREDLIAFIKVRVSNPGSQPVSASFGAMYNPRRTDDSRATLPCRAWYQAKFMDASAFKAGASNEVEQGQAVKNGHLVFMYGGLSGEESTDAPQTDPAKLGVQYDFSLAPRQSKTLEFKVPFVPIALAKAGELSQVRAMGYARTFSEVLSFWDDIFSRALRVDLPDAKVVDTMKASLAYDLIARDIQPDGTHFIQTVNKFQYHDFYPRDTSFIARSYELLNLPDIARETIEHYLVRNKDGKVVKFLRIQPDDWGQSLWAVGSYFRTAGDLEFARDVHPAIAPHLDEFETETSKDPLGLWPVAGPYDNELIDGHYTSHNLWALLGLQEAENLCRAVGDKATADRAAKLYRHFKEVFLNRLAVLAKEDEGYIPPGMDDPNKGYDWENATGCVYPFGVLPPDNPWVSATVNMEREYKYREGIMTWGPNAWVGKQAPAKGVEFDPLYLHDYETFQVTETLLARGEQRKVVEDLYSTLVHTSSTNAGFETSIRPWGNRNPDDNLPPHGWFAARYNELVRNMLLREVGDELHLASALAPRWIEPGKTLSIRHGANNFGTIDFQIHSRTNGADVEIQPSWRTPPRALVFHIPWFVHLVKAEADGAPLEAKQDSLVFAPAVHRLTLEWSWREHPDLSYETAVRLWLHKAYEHEPGEDTDHLFPTLTRPGLADPNVEFLGSYNLDLRSRSGMGKIHYTLDGSDPNPRSREFHLPVQVTRTTLIKAIEVLPDGSSSEPLVAKVVKAQIEPSIGARQARAGLQFQYFEGTFQAMPNFAAMTPSAGGVARVADLDAVKHRAENFALEFSGFVLVPKDGIYAFTSGSDDGSKLWIGDDLVVDNDGPHPYAEKHGQVALRAGLHRFKVQYFDAGGANSLHVFWSGPGLPRRQIPASAYFH